MDNITNLLNISESIDEKSLASHKITQYYNDDGRMIMKSDLKDTTTPLSIVRLLCNGVVIDTIEDKVLSLPMPMHYSYNNINKNKFKKLYEQKLYKVSKAVDGSTCTLYSFDGQVCISTSSTIDITGISLRDCPSMDKLLFKSLPQSFLQQVGLKESIAGLTWDLPDNICITLGFHNHLMHYGNCPDMAWLIGVKNRDTGEILKGKTYGLKFNESLSSDITFDNILDKVNEPFDKAHNESNFGYIFESLNPELTKELSRVFIPSNYYNDLELMYMLSGIRNNKVRDDEIILKLILENNAKINNIKKINLKLYTIINHYEMYLDVLSNNIYTDFKEGTFHNEFSVEVITKIKREEPDINNDEIIKELIHDHVYDIQNIKIFLKMFCPKKLN